MNGRRRGYRAVALIRVSKVGGRGEDLLSPDLQRAAITDYATARGFAVERWVEALDESGSQRRSPWWRRLDQAVEWVEQGEVDAILVWKFSRAARWRRAWAVALDRVESAGGVIESATEQLDTTTSTGRFARGMLAEMAAWDAEVKGEQWREVHANRLARGLPANGKPRYGYTATREGFTPDPDTAPFVVGMYQRFIEGDTARSIAIWLSAEGATTSGGRLWASGTVRTYLDSGFAAGQLITKDGVFPGAHPPLITPQVWAHYQRVRQTTRHQPPRNRHPAHPLSGLIKCGVCGSPAHRKTWRSPSTPTIQRYQFMCFRRANLGSVGCAGSGVEQRIVFDAVKAWLTAVADDVDTRTNAISQGRAKAGEERAFARRLTRAVEQLDESLARLAVQQAILPAPAYAMARDDLLGQREEASARLIDAQNSAEALAHPAPKVARLLLDSFDERAQLDPKGLRDVLASLISRIEIHPGHVRGARSRLVIVPRWES